MDNIEAIDILRKNKPTSDPRLCGKELCEAVDIAINALENREEYKWHNSSDVTPEGDESLKEVIMRRVYSDYEIIGLARYVKSTLSTGESKYYWCEQDRGWLGHPEWVTGRGGDSSLVVEHWRNIELP